MKKQSIIRWSTVAFILFSALSITSVSIMALFDPQAVMQLVQVKLTNTDAYSSIRGVYGGVGCAIVTMLVYLAIRDRRNGLRFLVLLWGGYALSRLITIGAEGALGAFGTQWLVIESVLFVIGIVLLLASRKVKVS